MREIRAGQRSTTRRSKPRAVDSLDVVGTSGGTALANALCHGAHALMQTGSGGSHNFIPQ
jgi:hypothetical protein